MKRNLFFLLILLSCFLGKCKEQCHQLPGLSENFLTFAIVDSVTGKNLLSKAKEGDSSIYQIDSIAIYDENKNLLSNFHYYYRDIISISSGTYRVDGYSIEMYFLSRQAGVEDPYLPDSANYFLYLNGSDTDTISVAYDYDPGKNDCNWKYNYFRIYFNGQPIEKASRPDYRAHYLLKK